MCWHAALRTQFEISAPLSTVWDILTDLPSYSNWNPMMISSSILPPRNDRSAPSTPSEGDHLSNVMTPNGQKPMKFSPIVLRCAYSDTNAEFRWLGSLGCRGIFDGEHYFQLEKMDDEHTRVTHGENFSGALVALLKLFCCLESVILKNTRIGFRQWNEAWKARAEQRAANNEK